MTLKVVTKLGDVPIGGTVHKIGGTYEYVVKDKISIWPADGKNPIEIGAEDGCRYLVGEGITINAYPCDKEVIWHTSIEELNDAYEGRMEGSGGEETG